MSNTQLLTTLVNATVAAQRATGQLHELVRGSDCVLEEHAQPFLTEARERLEQALQAAQELERIASGGSAPKPVLLAEGPAPQVGQALREQLCRQVQQVSQTLNQLKAVGA